MAVVINEFEVEPQAATQPASTIQPGSPASAPQPSANEIEKLMRLRAERFERIRAH